MKRIDQQQNNCIEKSSSTKNMILVQANEIINGCGITDFRVDSLSTSLDISPGNITYHFPRKEDILNSIWLHCLNEIESRVEVFPYPEMDMSGLFEYYKVIFTVLKKYVGVASYKLGDIGSIRSRTPLEIGCRKNWKSKSDKIMESLIANGYIDQPKDKYIHNLAVQASFVSVFWAVNGLMISMSGRYKDNNKNATDKYAVVAMSRLYAILTAKGKEDFAAIVNKCNLNHIISNSQNSQV